MGAWLITYGATGRPRRAGHRGASGIGAAIAAAYADEGARLLLADRDGTRLKDSAQRCAAAGATVVTDEVDVTDTEGTRRLVERCVTELGGVDVLVNCAGILTQAPLVEMDPKTWDDMIAADLRSVFLCCRWAMPHMLERGWGRVVNIASQLGIKGGESLTHYSAAKAGVIGLTRPWRVRSPPAACSSTRSPRPHRDSAGRRHHLGVEASKEGGATAGEIRTPRRSRPNGRAACQRPGRKPVCRPGARPKQRRRHALNG